MASTNYFNTFIEVAEDCPANKGEIPPIKGNKKSVHSDVEGKIALFGMETEAYLEFIANENMVKKKTMRSKRAK